MSTMMLRKVIPKCAGLAWMAVLSFMATSIAAAAEIRQRQVVDDVEIVLAVLHAEREPEPRIESQYEHHLVVWLFDKSTSKSLKGAQVKAEVAEAGYAGSGKLLKPMMVEGKPAYSGFFAMPGRSEYRIMVQIKRPGKPRVIEAHFEYRHHHKLR
ncbi:MAG: hypothetical protein HZA59_06930 [Hydrogenophilales bacterium]|nr:hypothetical protein [Hydrogenophilales bacterium]